MDATSTARASALYRTIKELADATSQDLTLRQALVLLYVAAHGPIAQGEVVDRLDMGKGTASKVVTALGGVSDGIKYADGFGLLSSDSDPDNRRSKLLALTKDGERLISRILKAIFKE